jgi:outer membrane protein assembly factor BamB
MTNKLIATIKNIQHYYEIESSHLLYIDKQYNLRCISKDNFKEIWYFGNVYNFFINKEYVVCGIVGNEKTAILNLNNGTKVSEFDFDLNIKGKRTELYYYGSTYRNNEPVILRFDLSKNELAGIFPSLFGIRTIIDDTYYLAVQKKRILNKKLIENDTTLWQFDIGQFGTYKDKKFINKEPEVRQREINRVYYHNNKIIVTLSRAIIALNPENGELIWKIDFENYHPVDLLFDGDIAYSGRLIYFAIIDIEKGIKLFEKDFDPAYRFEIEGFKLSQIGYIGLTLHENNLWFTHEDKGHQFLLKANPQNGDILDGMLLETTLSTHPPIFDENRMYILDQEGNLYIYERG